MSSRRRGMRDRDPFDRDAESLDRLDSELFGDLERVGRPVVLRLDEIRTDGGTQPRAELNQDVIAEYAEAIKDGAQFPPVDVFYDGSNYWLADGFHRYHAHGQAGKETIRAIIHQGDQRAAVLFSVGVNAEHGLRRTNEDKRRAVMTLLQDREWSEWSDREIARQAKVSHGFVGNLRKKLTGFESSDDAQRTYRDKHGNISTMKTGGISGANQDRAIDESDQDDPPAGFGPSGDQSGGQDGRQRRQDAQSGAPATRTADNADQAQSDAQSGQAGPIAVDENELERIMFAGNLAGAIGESADQAIAALSGTRDLTVIDVLELLPAEQAGQLATKLGQLRNMLVSEARYIDQVLAILERVE